MAIKDEVATRLVVALFRSKWGMSVKGANIQMLGDSFYVKMKRKIRICEILAKNEDGNETDTEISGELYGKKWKLTLEDARIIKRISAMKSVKVTVKDVLNKISIEKLKEWMQNFGEIHKIEPKIKEVPYMEKIRKDEEIPEDQKKDILEWCKARSECGPDVEVTNGSESERPNDLTDQQLVHRNNT